MARPTLLTVLALGLPALAGAQEAFHDGRIRHVEPGVSIQRASETAAEEAVPNLPFLPGDRVWTDRSGRVEFQFADGTLLRSDSRSKLDRWADRRPEYLPEEVAPYAGELEASGAWYYESEVGHVWRPYVPAGWSPYTDGRWVWTAYGWTWVPYEGWGWATCHYGRW